MELPADLRAVLEGIAAGVTVQDESGRLLFVNEDAAALAGFASPAAMLRASPGEIVSRFELIDEGGRPFDPSRLPGRQVIAGRTPEPVLVGFRLLPDQAERWSMLRARGATLADGRRVAVNTFHDVTPRIEMEARIRASERRTRELAEERSRAEVLARMLADAVLRLDEAQDVDATAQAAAEAGLPLLADWSVVDLIQPDGRLRRTAVAARDPELAALVEPLRDHPSTHAETRASRRVARSGTPLVVPDIEAYWRDGAEPDPDLRRLLVATGIRSAVVQPLFARGEVIGSMSFVTVGDRTIEPATIAASSELASRVGLSIANAASYAAEQQARHAAEALAERMERLQQVTRILAESATADEVVSIVADEARHALDARSVVIGLVDESTTTLTVAFPASDADTTDVGSAVAADEPLAVAVREARPVWPDDPATRGAQTADADGGAVAAVPLIAGDQTLGGLAVRFEDRRTLSADDQRLLRSYADLAGGALVRLRLSAVGQQLLLANETERARLESVLRQMPLGVILAAPPDGRYLFANDTARRIAPFPIELGDTPPYGRVRGFRRDGQEVAPDSWPLRRALRGETVENDVIEVHYEDGTRRSFGLSSAPIIGPGGSIDAAILTFADLTQQILAQERERFLVRASEILTSSLDYERTVQSVADLTVPEFADWCAIHLEGEDGVPVRTAVAHRDPDKVALAAYLQEAYPPDPDAATGTAAIMRSGRSEWMADIPAELIAAAARDERHLELIRSLELRSYVAVPLIAAGRTIGVLTLVNGESGRRFREEDIAFAENLAARAAASIENARLFREGVRFKRLLDATGDAVLMLDPERGRIVYANRGAATQLERPVEDLIGSSIVEHVESPGIAAVEAALATMAEGRDVARTETIGLRRASGGTLPVEVRLEHVASDAGPVRILAIARDISDRIRAEETLRGLAAAEHARAAELNAVIRAMGDGVVVCDREGRIILANPAAEDVFPDVEKRTYREVLDLLEDPEGTAPALGVRGGPVELKVRGDEDRWVELSTWPVASGRGAADDHEGETIVLLRDVTEQRQAQAVRDTFIGVLSHELRTPVTTIYAGAKVLARPGELAEATRSEIFADIVVESERLHRLVEDVVAMTRFGEERGDVGAEPVLLQRLLPSVVASEDARWPGVTFEVEIEGGLPTVIADPTYVEQVVRNLLSNAAKYGGPGTTVRARVQAARDEVQVRILDDGPGFPPDEQDRLFELFFRSAQTARQAAGAGIGLFVCARLIRAMGGRIWAANRPEGGAEFGFALRVMDEDA
ncbi:MAG TPA: GAF domain-containing protein [Candidatus Limnocylindrales bacterium]|nr:GAF domain-containing protein [Candidatus Limnocylindrales bacterium]